MAYEVRRKTPFDWWLWLLAVLLSSTSLVSLVQKFFNIGLTPVFADYLQFYRAVVYPFSDTIIYVLRNLTGIHTPEWYREAWPLSFLILATNAKAIHEWRRNALDGLAMDWDEEIGTRVRVTSVYTIGYITEILIHLVIAIAL